MTERASQAITGRLRDAERRIGAAGGPDFLTWQLERFYRDRGFTLGADGKRYPSQRRSDETRTHIASTVHVLAHRGFSVRRIVARLAEGGLAVSVGSVHRYVHDWTCPHCSRSEPERSGVTT